MLAACEAHDPHVAGRDPQIELVGRQRLGAGIDKDVDGLETHARALRLRGGGPADAGNGTLQDDHPEFRDYAKATS